MGRTQVIERTREVPRWHRRRISIAMLFVAAALIAAGCGSSSSSSTASSAAAGATSTGTSTTKFAKTKFVLHAGLAFGAFHRWIYKPVKAGDLKHPFEHKLTLVKGALAAAFVIHELNLALADAQADPTLSKLVAPITALQAKLKAVPSDLRSGNANPADVLSANDSIGSLKQLAANAGQPITEQVPSSP
jgi:hypothetical protein